MDGGWLTERFASKEVFTYCSACDCAGTAVTITQRRYDTLHIVEL